MGDLIFEFLFTCPRERPWIRTEASFSRSPTGHCRPLLELWLLHPKRVQMVCDPKHLGSAYCICLIHFYYLSEYCTFSYHKDVAFIRTSFFEERKPTTFSFFLIYQKAFVQRHTCWLSFCIQKWFVYKIARHGYYVWKCKTKKGDSRCWGFFFIYFGSHFLLGWEVYFWKEDLSFYYMKSF